MADRPKNMVTILRQIASSSGGSLDQYPEWFQEEWKTSDKAGDTYAKYLHLAADELENMQKLNGKLYKTLYPS